MGLRHLAPQRRVGYRVRGAMWFRVMLGADWSEARRGWRVLPVGLEDGAEVFPASLCPVSWEGSRGVVPS